LEGRKLGSLPPLIGQVFSPLFSQTSLIIVDDILSVNFLQATGLKSLNLNWNYFHTLPREIGQLTNLTQLNLAETSLKFLPVTVTNLTSLDFSTRETLGRIRFQFSKPFNQLSR
jgi:internalin A